MSTILTSSLVAWVEVGPPLTRVADRVDPGWYVAKNARRAVANFDVMTQEGVTDLGKAIDAVLLRGERIWPLLRNEQDIDVDLALWFEASGGGQTAMLRGDWLARCGRSFDVWAEVLHWDDPAEDPTDPGIDTVVVKWSSEGLARNFIIREAVAAKRQSQLETVLADAAAQRARSIQIHLQAGSGNAGIIVPARIINGLRALGAQLEVTGERVGRSHE